MRSADREPESRNEYRVDPAGSRRATLADRHDGSRSSSRLRVSATRGPSRPWARGVKPGAHRPADRWKRESRLAAPYKVKT